MPNVSEKLKRRMDRVKYMAATMYVIKAIEHNTCNHDGQLIVAIRRSATAYAGISLFPVSECVISKISG